MSDSVRPQRRQPTRLPHPWDSPGKNTGVGCHFLLQCMKLKSESEVTQLGPSPSDPMDCSLPGSSNHGIFQARVLEWVAIAFSHCNNQRQVIIAIVQSLSLVRLFVTPWTEACQASLSITNSQSLLKLMSIESVTLPNHLILCHPLLFLPSVFPRIRVFPNESALPIRWPKCLLDL